MSKLISIRDDLYEKLKETKDGFPVKEPKSPSFSDSIEYLFSRIAFLEKELDSLQETTVTQEGRISKSLALKTILYKVKE